MKKISEVVTSYIDESFIYVDVFFEGEEYGKSVALIDTITGRVIFKDNDFRIVPEVKNVINERLEELKKMNQLLEVVEVCLPVEKEHETEEIFNSEMVDYFKESYIDDSNRDRFIGFSNFHYDKTNSTVYAKMYFKLDKH